MPKTITLKEAQIAYSLAIEASQVNQWSARVILIARHYRATEETSV